MALLGEDRGFSTLLPAPSCPIFLPVLQVTPLTALKFAELTLKAGIPKGVVNILPGSGEERGAGSHWGRRRRRRTWAEQGLWPKAAQSESVQLASLWGEVCTGKDFSFHRPPERFPLGRHRLCDKSHDLGITVLEAESLCSAF
jgi:hypothetical protein